MSTDILTLFTSLCSCKVEQNEERQTGTVHIMANVKWQFDGTSRTIISDEVMPQESYFERSCSTGENEICDKKTYQDFLVQMKSLSNPKLLFITIERSLPDQIKNGKITKFKNKSETVVEDEMKIGNDTYRLVAVGVHDDRLGKDGHYLACTMSDHGEFIFNDQDPKKVRVPKSNEVDKMKKSATTLIYRKKENFVSGIPQTTK